MPRRKTPRPPEETRAIVRALRKRYITPEAEATAKAAFARINLPLPGADRRPAADAPRPVETGPAEPPPEQPTLIQVIRTREGIPPDPSPPTGSFSDDEQKRARGILARLQARFATKQ